MIGNISNKPVIRQTYLFKLNLANILPAGIEDIEFVNSIARSLGLHDFYQVGLWNFCEGYDDEYVASSPTNRPALLCSEQRQIFHFKYLVHV